MPEAALHGSGCAFLVTHFWSSVRRTVRLHHLRVQGHTFLKHPVSGILMCCPLPWALVGWPSFLSCDSYIGLLSFSLDAFPALKSELQLEPGYLCSPVATPWIDYLNCCPGWLCLRGQKLKSQPCYYQGHGQGRWCCMAWL